VPPDNQPLTGRTVLVTRPGKAGESLCNAIASRNGRPILLPTLAIESVEPDPAATIPLAEIAIFVSRAAVEFGTAFLHNRRMLPPDTVFAVGKATAAELAARGITAITPPAGESNSEGLLAMSQLQAERIRRQKVLIFRGQGGREHLADSLRRRGAEVHYVEVYKRRPLAPDIAAAIAAAGNQRPETIVATSTEVLDALAGSINAQRQQWLFSLPMITLSGRIADHAAALGFTGSIHLARNPGEEAVLEALEEWAGTTR
jgi:uroporphyrinogen-III synthase